MIIKLLNDSLFKSMFIRFHFTFERKFKDLIIFFNKISINEAAYAFAGDIE